MTKSCAVPRCKTGYKSNKQKCSVFKVPKDTEQLKKWQAAIPGVELKPSQHVCEKHFEKKCILKEWIKHDNEGRIIARATYIHPRLASSAVPTIFHTSTLDVPDDSGLRNKATEREVGSPRLLGRDEAVLPTEIIDCATFARHCSPETLFDRKRVAKYESCSPSVSNLDDIIPPVETVKRQWTKCKDSSPRVSIAAESIVLLKNLCKNSVPKDIAAIETFVERDKNLVVSNATISDSGIPAGTDIDTSVRIVVPKSWGVTEFVEEKGQSIVFSHFVKKKEKDIEVPISDKCISLDRKKTLSYSIYGRPVNPEKGRLPYVLEDTTLLPNILERFKNMNVCSGLGAVNIDYLPAHLAFKDYTERWRDNDCTMLTKWKRCNGCTKMRHRVMKRETRVKQTHNFKRIRRASNPLDQEKLVALCRKNRREKRAKNRAKLRVQLLSQSMKEKGN